MSLFRINNILVPVDLSESSLNALDAAVVIAKKHNASIQLLHVEENCFTVKVGPNASYAQYNLLKPQMVISLLENMNFISAPEILKAKI